MLYSGVEAAALVPPLSAFVPSLVNIGRSADVAFLILSSSAICQNDVVLFRFLLLLQCLPKRPCICPFCEADVFALSGEPKTTCHPNKFPLSAKKSSKKSCQDFRVNEMSLQGGGLIDGRGTRREKEMKTLI
ncbi:hypothetical protein BUALT_Bualt03G0066500 [Buddleja alternifolia]|uniref:Uncharacterized protein n=1 Tax=Buddleja alternifolia TaxID=168488 RepID=A0AAV6XSU6_9LAMI|nr:hypothetical protein BUALT_Bualt03G0066500 [Buddleja alternifolia]